MNKKCIRVDYLHLNLLIQMENNYWSSLFEETNVRQLIEF